jgi:hypothetical protein
MVFYNEALFFCTGVFIHYCAEEGAFSRITHANLVKKSYPSITFNVNCLWTGVYKLKVLILQWEDFFSFHISTALVVVGHYINR